MQTRIDRLMARIRAAHTASGRTLADLARKTRLHQNTILRLYDHKWSPAMTTIRALEAALLPPLPEGSSRHSDHEH
jgi:lambda repressor-like predicted transcriptional regulator